jgi:transposase
VRGDEQLQSGFVVMSTLEDVVPDDHPLRAIGTLVDGALAEMGPALDALYASRGRPSIAPEYLLRAQLAQILYAIPSERRLCEELAYNLLLRWFVGLPLDQAVFHPTSFTENRPSPRPFGGLPNASERQARRARGRLLTTEVAQAFFEVIRAHAEAHKLLSREHFSLDGTLLEAAASLSP